MNTRKVTVKDIEHMVDVTGGNISQIARNLGVARGTVYARIETSPTLRAAIDDARETVLDNVESALYNAVLNGNVTAMIFWLKTQGYRRGWGNQAKLTLASDKDEPVTFRFEWADDGEDFGMVD